METALKLSNQFRSRGLLGSLLLNQQLITQKQLDQAIEHQCNHGGRLGTCLLEIHCIEEEKLTRVLNQQWQRPYFSSTLLMNIPREVLQLLTAKITCKHKILPFKTDRDLLYLAVTNCRDFSLFQELEKLTNKQIVPVLFSDVRLAVALNKYFSLPLQPRYEKLAITISKQQCNRNDSLPRINPPNKPTKEPHTSDTATITKIPNYPEAKASAPDNRSPYDTYIQQLLQAINQQEILSALFSYLEVSCVSAAFFQVKNQDIIGGECMEADKSEDFASFKSAIKCFPVQNRVIEERIIYYGPCPSELKHKDLTGVFSRPEDNYFLCAPLSIKERTFATLCLELDSQQTRHQIESYKHMCQKLELAFQLLIIKNKILAGSDKGNE